MGVVIAAATRAIVPATGSQRRNNHAGNRRLFRGQPPADQKKALCKDITDAVVKNYKVPAEAVVITLVETPRSDKAKGGVMFSDMQPR
jgi:4-oxalocrotonate tautomerase